MTMNRIAKGWIFIFMALACVSGCSKMKAGNSDTIEALKAHMTRHDKSIRITSMAEAFAGLMTDEAKKQEMMAKINEGYTNMGIHAIYLVTGATAETNETVLGSLIHFNKAMTLSEARALLEQDDTYKGQTQGMIINGHFALAPATADGKTVTPKAVLAAFQDFK